MIYDIWSWSYMFIIYCYVYIYILICFWYRYNINIDMYIYIYIHTMPDHTRPYSTVYNTYRHRYSTIHRWLFFAISPSEKRLCHSSPPVGNARRAKAKGGHMLIIGDSAKCSWDAAMLLAGYFRMWPSEMKLGLKLTEPGYILEDLLWFSGIIMGFHGFVSFDFMGFHGIYDVTLGYWKGSSWG